MILAGLGLPEEAGGLRRGDFLREDERSGDLVSDCADAIWFECTERASGGVKQVWEHVGGEWVARQSASAACRKR